VSTFPTYNSRRLLMNWLPTIFNLSPTLDKLEPLQPQGPFSTFEGINADRIEDINRRAVEKCHQTEVLLETEINRLVAALAETRRVRASHEAALKVLEAK